MLTTLGRHQGGSRGRGQYYKNKYGGKGRSHGSGPANDDDESDAFMDARTGSSGFVAEWDELRTTLDRINRKSYGSCYRETSMRQQWQVTCLRPTLANSSYRSIQRPHRQIRSQ